MTALLSSGELANLDANARLSVPIGILKGVSWWQGQAVTVLAELVEEGLIRIYSLSEAAPLLARLIAKTDEFPDELAFELRAATADRYRELKLYGDGRLSLTKDVTAILGFTYKVEKPALYAQAFAQGLEIMTLRYRHNRLLRTKDLGLINLHVPAASSKHAEPHDGEG